MKNVFALTLFAGLVGASMASAAVPAGLAGGQSVTDLVLAQSLSNSPALLLIRNGADDPANHDINDDRRLRGLGIHHRRGRGADDGPNHDINDDHGGDRGHDGSGSSNSGPGNSGSNNSGSNNSGSNGSGSSNSGSGSSGSGKS